jgi:hypothetical protein
MAASQRSCIVRIEARQDLINADLELTHFNCQSLAIPAILAIPFTPSPLLYPSRIGVAFKHINRVHPRLARTLRCTLKVRQEIYPTDVMVKGEPLI